MRAVAAVLLVAALLATQAGAQEAAPDATMPGRLAGPDRVSTAAAVALAAFGRTEGAVLVRDDRPEDALAAGPLAAAHDVPLLLTHRQRLSDVTARALSDLGVQQVLLVGALDEAVRRAVDHLQVDVIGSDDPYTTAADIAAKLPSEHAFLAANWPDALAVGALAARRAAPVLLTASDELPSATAAALPARVTIAGGPAAVSDAVAAEVTAAGSEVERLAGPNRFETAARIAEGALADGAAGPMRWVVTGLDWPDALAVVPAVGEGLLLPVHGTDPEGSPATAALASDGTVVVVGGRAAVSDEVAEALGVTAFSAAVTELPEDLRQTMTGVSWREGCPVGLDDLRLITFHHHTFGGAVVEGRLIVAATVAEEVVDVLAQLYAAGFPIERAEPVDVYGGDDDASMDANNTSAFNCRTVAGSDRFSEHAYGTAIDLNPRQNPFVRGGTVAPPAGEAYLDRSDVRPGMIVEGDAVVRAFDAIGWGWGGRWTGSKDYQHFSESGR